MAIAIPTAFALARFRFVGAKGGVRALLATQMFPSVASAVPLYLLLETLHLLDSRAGLVLVYASTAVPVRDLPAPWCVRSHPGRPRRGGDGRRRNADAGVLEGGVPAARPAIAVTALFAFMSAWNESFWRRRCFRGRARFTLPVVLQRYVGEHDASWGPFAAGAILVSVPVMALFYVAQRQLVAGLTAGGVKG